MAVKRESTEQDIMIKAPRLELVKRILTDPGFRDRKVPPKYTGDAIYLGRGFQGIPFTIGATSSKIITSTYAWPYIIFNNSSIATLYIGSNSDINTTSGFPILAGKSREFIVGDGVEVWAIADTGESINVRVFQL